MAAKSAYGASAREIGELFADYLEGGPDRPALALSSNQLASDARSAIDKSLVAFGYAPDSCSHVTCAMLDPQAVFLLIEGLDPLYVIATDRETAALLAKAYRTDYQPDSPIRVAGRSGVAFTDLHALMSTPESKQKAWKLLKSLPR